MSPAQHRRRVGAVRPSHLMFTSGVGSLVDLPNFAVLVRGLDDWSHQMSELERIDEPRLLRAVQAIKPLRHVEELLPAPWRDGIDTDPRGPAATVGVPVVPFPAWMRCTACDELGPVSGPTFTFENDKPTRPHDARFFHSDCPKSKRRPLAVAARFVLTCVGGHLDDFPYREFVHHGGPCPKGADKPRLKMEDRGGNLGANVEIRCVSCGGRRNIREAMGKRNEPNLPNCRARHAHLSSFDPAGCTETLKVLVVGASNQWFAQTLSALAVPKTGASELATKVEQHWTVLEGLPQNMLGFGRSNIPKMKDFAAWDDATLWAAMEAHRVAVTDADDEKADEGYPDLRTAEWNVFSAAQLPDPHDDFTVTRPGVPPALAGLVEDVVQAERLREVRALVGFTRLDAPDPDDPDLVTVAPLARSSPKWVPASEVRGEGIFLRLPEGLLGDWEQRVSGSAALVAHSEAYGRFRRNRYSDRLKGSFEEMAHWPGLRYIALHTLSHLLIRTISLECGYSSASLSERIYAGDEDDPRTGILIYTAVPDAEGTLGGLVSLGEQRELTRLFRRALRDARRCSSDPLCAERLPAAPADFLHGAACHVCLFVSETTCERGNRFLDRRFVVPIDEPKLALFPDPL